MEQYAILVVDMIKDSFNPKQPEMHKQIMTIIPNINNLLEFAREKKIKVIYACDSRYPQDFIFSGNNKPHALRGTRGIEVIDELRVYPEDTILEKRCMSSFFRTDLDITLRSLGVTTLIIIGISTPYCVLLSALDAVQNGFKAIICEDCATAYKDTFHQNVINTYRKGPISSLFGISNLKSIINMLSEN